MNRAIGLFLVVLFSCVIVAPVFAVPAPIEKFKGGVEDIAKSPLELPRYTIAEVKSSSFKPMGFVGGLIKGTYHMVKQSIDGALDVGTFPLDMKK